MGANRLYHQGVATLSLVHENMFLQLMAYPDGKPTTQGDTAVREASEKYC
jgi:hypothetical protein